MELLIAKFVPISGSGMGVCDLAGRLSTVNGGVGRVTIGYGSLNFTRGRELFGGISRLSGLRFRLRARFLSPGISRE